MKRFILIPLVLIAAAIGPSSHAAGPDIRFFYSETCPHCRAEQEFLDDLQAEDPDLMIVRYRAVDSSARSLLERLLTEHDARRFLGVVPVTFVGEEFFVGYDSAGTTGARIRTALTDTGPQQLPEPTRVRVFTLPLIGDVDTARYSLPVLAVLLGLLDGFNICSLGALVLILGMVLALKDRRRIILFGGMFLLTTAVVYGLLIVLWFRVFSFLAPLTGAMDVVVSLLALGGAGYFFHEWRRMRRYGPTCGFTGNRFVNWVTGNVQSRLSGAVRFAPALIAILLFAGVITIVEFPCSAAVPVVFAGLVADAGYGTLARIMIIGLFVLFYLLDEIIVFAVAVSRMRLWLTDPGIVVWATLAEGIILLGIAFWYLRGIF